MKKRASLVVTFLSLALAGHSWYSQAADDKDTVLPGRHMSEQHAVDIAFEMLPHLPEDARIDCQFKDGDWEIMEIQKDVWGVSSQTTNANGRIVITDTNATRVLLKVHDADGQVEKIGDPTHVYPRESLVFAGYASPESAMESWAWAMSKGNKTVMLQSLTPEAHKGWEELLAGKTESQIRAESFKGWTDIQGYTIQKREVVSDNEVVLRITMFGRDQAQNYDMRKVRNEWKLNEPSDK